MVLKKNSFTFASAKKTLNSTLVVPVMCQQFECALV